MIRILTILTVLLLTALTLAGQTNTRRQATKKIPVPTEWINRVKSYDYKTNNAALIREFEKLIAPDTLELHGYGNRGQEGGILNPTITNLDDDGQEEIIALIGWTENLPMLAVFKQIDGQWYLIFTETFHVHYNSPELNIANVPSRNKTFYIRWLYERGSGIFRDSYHFYKLIDNQVYHCLELVNRAHIFGWGLYLNQEVQSSFTFNCATADAIWVTYDYNFFPGSVYDTDVPWDAHTDIPFVKDEKGVSYQWDSLTRSYEPEFYGQKDGLTGQKIACFGAFGNDSLFVTAFDYEIRQTLEKGTAEQKKLLTGYLEQIRADNTVPSPAGELEETGQAGGMKFHGIKKKE